LLSNPRIPPLLRPIHEIGRREVIFFGIKRDGWGCGWRLGTLLTASAALIVFGWIIQMLIPLPIAIAESASVFCGFSGALAPRCRGPEDVRVVAVVIAPFEFSDIQRQIFPADEAVRLPAPKA
jgi:hypothetical protein